MVVGMDLAGTGTTDSGATGPSNKCAKQREQLACQLRPTHAKMGQMAGTKPAERERGQDAQPLHEPDRDGQDRKLTETAAAARQKTTTG